MTSIEWLIEEMISKGYFKESVTLTNIDHLQYKAEEMEKQQIIDAVNQIEFDDIDGMGICDTNTKGEQYYNETYGSKGIDDHIVDTNEMASSQTEISDKEVEKEIKKRYETTQNDAGFRDGCAWYREQLKNKQ